MIQQTSESDFNSDYKNVREIHTRLNILYNIYNVSSWFILLLIPFIVALTIIYMITNDDYYYQLLLFPILIIFGIFLIIECVVIFYKDFLCKKLDKQRTIILDKLNNNENYNIDDDAYENIFNDVHQSSYCCFFV